MASNRRLRSARNIFLLNLILSDLLLVLTAVPVTPWLALFIFLCKTEYFRYALTKDWHFGSAMCHLMPLSNSCSVFVTSWSLTAISMDKFMHITDPTRAPVSVSSSFVYRVKHHIPEEASLFDNLIDLAGFVPHQRAISSELRAC